MLLLYVSVQVSCKHLNGIQQTGRVLLTKGLSFQRADLLSKISSATTDVVRDMVDCWLCVSLMLVVLSFY